MFWTHGSLWILPILIAAVLGGLAAIVSNNIFALAGGLRMDRRAPDRQ
jgi:hypothetical protein